MSITSGFEALDALLGIDDKEEAPRKRRPRAMLRDVSPRSPIGSLLWHPALRKRNAVGYLTVRSWSAAAKAEDLSSFKAEKRAKTPAVIDTAAVEVAQLVRSLFGEPTGWAVTNIACGHSRDAECWGKCLARAVALSLGIEFQQLFQDRFVKGSSHPKAFKDLPPLEWRDRPTKPILLVDDISTSGWHLEEAASVVRSAGACCVPCAWVSGVIKAR